MRWHWGILLLGISLAGRELGWGQPMTVAVTGFSSSTGATVVVTGPASASVSLEKSPTVPSFWSVVATLQLDANGRSQYQDTSATSVGQVYYRLRSSPLWLGGGPVYSVNVAGLFRKVIGTELMLFANPLQAPTNTVAAAFRAPLNGYSLFRLTGAGFEANNYLYGWTAPSTPFAPGEGFFLQNASGAGGTLVFFGELPVGTLTTPILAGHSLLSSKVPQTGRLETDLGFPSDSDAVYKFNGVSFEAYYHEPEFGWDFLEPNLAAGDAFWLITGSSRNWTRNFSPNFAPQAADTFTQSDVTSSPWNFTAASGSPVQVNFFTYNSTTSFGRVYDTDASTLVGPAFVGQLYAGTSNSEGSLAAVGSPVAFESGQAAGRINSGLVSVPGISAGQYIYLQLRVWEIAKGASYAAAVANGSKNGKSAIFSVSAVPPPDNGPAGPPPSANGFTSFSLTAPPVVLPFGATLDGAQDGGGGRQGTGAAVLSLSGTTLTLNGSFSGLSGTVNGAHIHGPASPGSSAAVLYGIFPLITLDADQKSGTISGTINLTAGTGGYNLATQMGQLTNGLWYVNIHSSTFGGGEIRGQIVAAAPQVAIVAQPQSRTNLVGSNVTFSVLASGTPPLFYQWYFNTTNQLTGATNSSLSLTSIQLSNAGGYHVVVTNSTSSATSVVAMLSVNPADDIDGDGMQDAWEVAHFGSIAGGLPLADLDLDGMTNLDEYRADTSPVNASSYLSLSSLTLTGNTAQMTVSTRAGLTYGVEYSDSLDVVAWQLLLQALGTGGVLTVNDGGPLPARRFYRVWAQRSVEVPRAYSVNVVGFANVGVTPGSNWLAVPFLTFPSTVDSLIPYPPDGSCVVKAGGLSVACFFYGSWDPPGMSLARGEAFEFHNPLGIDIVLTFVGEVGGRPVVVDQPKDTAATVGGNASFQVASVGSVPLRHQWFFNRTNPISGGTNAGLSLTNLQLSQGGEYSVVVSNAAGSVTSAVALLNLQPPLRVRVNGALANADGVAVTNSALLALETTYPGGVMFYTLNGASPGSGALYSGPVVVGTSVVMRAIAYSADFAESAEAGPVPVTVRHPPAITQQPATQTVLSGQPVVFSTLAGGDAPLSYQWFFNGAPIAGATGNSFTRDGALLSHAGSYWVVVSNPYGNATSAVAGLTVLLRPSVVAQPTGTNVNAGQSATFCVSAIGSAPLLFQWRRNGVNIPGATNACYTVTNVQAINAGAYSVVVGNGADAITSAEAVLGLADLPNSPLAEDHFANRNGLPGHSGALEVNNFGATKEPGEPDHAGKPGGASVWYKWTPTNAGIATVRTSGSAFDTLLAVYRGSEVTALTPVAANEDGGGALTSEVRFNATNAVEYQIAIDGFAGAQGSFVLSWSLEVTTQTLPAMTAQPQSQTVPAGGTAIFSISPSGTNRTYQWHFNGARLNGETSATLTVSNVQAANVGYYFVAVTNAAGRGALSDTAVLEIGPFADVRSADKVEDLLGGPAPFAPAAAGVASVAIGTLGTQILSTTNSTTSFRETNHCGVIGGSSRWFKLRPSANGLLAIDTFGSTFDTVLATYTGDALLGGYPTKLIACNNDADPANSVRWSRVLYPATNAIDYLIAVDGAGASAGTVQLNWSLGLPPVIVSNPPASTPLVGEGQTLQLTTTLTNGLPPPQLQWYLNGQPLADATNATYEVSAAQRQSGGVYTVVAYNTVGSVTSTVANVTVEIPLELNLQPVVQNGQVHFRVSGVASQTFLLQGSTNFVHWQPLFTNSAPGAPVSYDDLSTTNRPRRYYRALPWP